jgi:hypothetical protein
MEQLCEVSNLHVGVNFASRGRKRIHAQSLWLYFLSNSETICMVVY